MRRINIARTGLTMSVLAAVSSALAQTPSAAILNDVRLTPQLAASVPMDASFQDESGERVELRHFLTQRPVVLLPVLYRCPMLCTQVLNALSRRVDELDFAPGKDYEIVIISIDPRETPSLAADKKLHYLAEIRNTSRRRGWHFLVGAEPDIHRVTDAIGYHFVYDKRTDQFAHPAAAAVLTSDGKISRYLIGIDYSKRDMRLSLLDASRGAIGTWVDHVVLRCYSYDPATGRYGLTIMNSLRIGGGLTVLLLLLTITFLGRRRGRARSDPAPPFAEVPQS